MRKIRFSSEKYNVHGENPIFMRQLQPVCEKCDFHAEKSEFLGENPSFQAKMLFSQPKSNSYAKMQLLCGKSGSQTKNPNFHAKNASFM